MQPSANDPNVGDTLSWSIVSAPAGSTIDPSSGEFRWSPSDGPEQSTNVTLRVVDDGRPTLFDTVSFAVTVLNVAPTIALTGSESVEEGETFSLTLGAVTDPGQDTVSGYIINWGDGTSTSLGAGEIGAGVIAHVYAAAGNYTITVALIDEDGTHPGAGRLSVTIVPPPPDNFPPVIEPIGPQSVAEGSELVLVVTATDVEGHNLTFSLVDAPGGATIDPGTGEFRWTPVDGPGDTTTVTVRVTDDGEPVASSTAIFSITVTNVAPTIALAGAAATDVGALYALTLGTVTDPGDDTVTQYIVNWDDGASTTVLAAELGDGTATHTYATAGDYVITVDLVDEDGLHVSAGTLNVTVNPVVAENQPPVIAPIDPQTVAEGTELVLTVVASDPDGDGITFSLETAPVGATIDVVTGEFRWTPADGPDDSTTVVVRVTDDGEPSLFTTISFDVTVTNVAPTIALSGAGTVIAGETYTLTLGAVTDPGEDTVTQYIVNWGDGASTTIQAADLGDGTVSHTYTAVGSYTIRVDLVDEDGLHGAAGTLALTVLDADTPPVNQPPVIGPIDPQTVAEGTELVLTVVASDPDGDGITFSLDTAPAGAMINALTGEFRWTPADGPDDSTTIVIRVTDNGEPALFTTISFEVTVTNVAPTIALTGAPTVIVDEVYTLTLGAVTDPGDDTVTEYIVNWGDGASTTITAAELGDGTVSHTYTAVGNYVITVDLVDEDGLHEAAGTLALAVTTDAITEPRLVTIPSGLFVLSGGSVTVPVQVDNAAQIGNIELQIGYDASVLWVTAVRAGDLLAGFVLAVDLEVVGVITITLGAATGLGTGPADLVEIDFRALLYNGNRPPTPVDLQRVVLATVTGVAFELVTTPQVGGDSTDGEINLLSMPDIPRPGPFDRFPPGREPRPLDVRDRDWEPPAPPRGPQAAEVTPLGPDDPYVIDDAIVDIGNRLLASGTATGPASQETGMHTRIQPAGRMDGLFPQSPSRAPMPLPALLASIQWSQSGLERSPGYTINFAWQSAATYATGGFMTGGLLRNAELFVTSLLQPDDFRGFDRLGRWLN